MMPCAARIFSRILQRTDLSMFSEATLCSKSAFRSVGCLHLCGHHSSCFPWCSPSLGTAVTETFDSSLSLLLLLLFLQRFGCNSLDPHALSACSSSNCCLQCHYLKDILKLHFPPVKSFLSCFLWMLRQELVQVLITVNLICPWFLIRPFLCCLC